MNPAGTELYTYESTRLKGFDAGLATEPLGEET